MFLCVVGPILAPEPDQNQPLMLAGCRSGRSQPLKLHLRPDVQMYRTLPAGHTDNFSLSDRQLSVRAARSVASQAGGCHPSPYCSSVHINRKFYRIQAKQRKSNRFSIDIRRFIKIRYNYWNNLEINIYIYIKNFFKKKI